MVRLAAIVPGVGDVVEGIVDALIGLILRPIVNWVSGPFIEWLVHVPNYSAGNEEMASHLDVTTALSFGVIASTMTLAAFHYWAAGMSVSSHTGGAPLEAIQRAVGAVLFIAAWPWIFHNSVEAGNLLGEGLVGRSGIEEANMVMIDWITGEGSIVGLGGIIALLIAITFFLVILSITLMKIGLTVGLAVLFIGMPLAVSLWVLPSAAWIAHLCLRSFTAIVIIPAVWALTVCALAAITNDFDLWSAGSSAPGGDPTPVDDLTRPLVAIVGWFMLIKLAQLILRSAGALPTGGGGLQHFFSFLGSHMAMGAMAAHLPDALGGSATSQAERASQDAYRSGRQALGDLGDPAAAAQLAGTSSDPASFTRGVQDAQLRETNQAARRLAEEQAREQARTARDARGWRPDDSLTQTRDGVAQTPKKMSPLESERAAFSERYARGHGDWESATKAYENLPENYREHLAGLSRASGSSEEYADGIAGLSSAPNLDPELRENLRRWGAGHEGFVVADSMDFDSSPPPTSGWDQMMTEPNPTEQDGWGPDPFSHEQRGPGLRAIQMLDERSSAAGMGARMAIWDGDGLGNPDQTTTALRELSYVADGPATRKAYFDLAEASPADRVAIADFDFDNQRPGPPR